MPVQTRRRALGIHGRNLSLKEVQLLPPPITRKGPSKLAKISKHFVKPERVDRKKLKRMNCH